jgi:hypothetical protein
MRRFWRENSLSIVFLGFFLAAIAGQAVAGWHEYNDHQVEHHAHSIGFGRYLVSSSFGRAVLENWQSEYLQFTLYILLTVWLIQKGSAESKKPGDAGGDSDESPRRPWVYENSLVLVMASIWLLSWAGQSVTGWSDWSSDELLHGGHAKTWWEYVTSASFWESTLQNWQSEFLAVGTMAAFSIYLRQRGSPESKPVAAPHDQTGA